VISVNTDAVQRLVLQQAALLEDLRDVPADRLAFAVRVGREVQGVGALRGLRDRIDVLFVLVDQVVAHGEPVVGVDRRLPSGPGRAQWP
jgi:hypothetical protein